jgi:hypothetical protein
MGELAALPFNAGSTEGGGGFYVLTCCNVLQLPKGAKAMKKCQTGQKNKKL